MEIKKIINPTLIKALVALLLFQIAYTFIYSIILRNFQPFAFIERLGYPVLYSIVAMLVGGLPYILGGYLIMLGRNSHEKLEEKNLEFALSTLAILVGFYLILTILQALFPYRNFYDIFINLNLPLLRSLNLLDLSNLVRNLLILLACFIMPFYVYIGGMLRLKRIEMGVI